MDFSAIITAGGTSSRYGNKNKLLEKINGKEVIKYSTEVFLNHSEIKNVVICANKMIIAELKCILGENPKLKIIEGGAVRQESVFKGLKEIDTKYVLIHDGARPVISADLVTKIIEVLPKQKALTVATKTTDTIKVVNKGKVVKTLNRDELYNIQTPQAFETKIIKEAHEKLNGQSFSDDAGMVEAIEKDVYIFENDYKNIKITTKNDLDIAKIYLKL